MSVVVRPAAVADVRRGRERYVDLLDEFEDVLERLELFPMSGRAIEGVPGLRRARLPHLSYGVFYRVTGTDVRVLRVLHAKQDVVRAFGSEQHPEGHHPGDDDQGA